MKVNEESLSVESKALPSIVQVNDGEFKITNLSSMGQQPSEPEEHTSAKTFIYS